MWGKREIWLHAKRAERGVSSNQQEEISAPEHDQREGGKEKTLCREKIVKKLTLEIKSSRT